MTGPTETVTPEQRMFDFGMRRYGERLASIVADLRYMADEVEREGRVRPEPDVMGTPALIWSAQTVVHRVLWGVANLHLDGLVNIAGDTEAARNRLPDSGRRHGNRKGGRKIGMDHRTIAGDDEPFDPSHLLHLAPRVVLWGGNHFADRLPASRGWLVWDKRDGHAPNDQSDVELAWTNFLTTARSFSAYWNGNTRTGREQAEGRFHVNQKPVALMHWCLELVGADGPIVDPYMGSGSTLIAAKERGIRSIGIDLDERNCEIAAKRLAQEVLDFGGVA